MKYLIICLACVGFVSCATYSNEIYEESRIRFNFHTECEIDLNEQANKESYASHVYQSMYVYFSRDDLALPGFAKFFKEMSDEEREHAHKIYEYINLRGGTAEFKRIPPPKTNIWGTPLEAVLTALDLEKELLEHLLQLHGKADSNNDPHMTDFLEEHYLEEQYRSMKQLSTLARKLERVGNGIGAFLVDKDLQDGQT